MALVGASWQLLAAVAVAVAVAVDAGGFDTAGSVAFGEVAVGAAAGIEADIADIVDTDSARTAHKNTGHIHILLQNIPAVLRTGDMHFRG